MGKPDLQKELSLQICKQIYILGHTMFWNQIFLTQNLKI